jgi:hypothetical protein
MEELKRELEKLQGENVALTESYLQTLLTQYAAGMNLSDLIAKKIVRRIKTGDQTFYLLVREVTSPPSTGKRRAEEPADQKENATSKVFIDEDIDRLRQENNNLLKELGINGFEDAMPLYTKYIDSLHDYNELKDIVQALIGRLALIRNQTTKELYPDFGLNAGD